MLVHVQYGTGTGYRYMYYRWAVRVTRACVIHAYVYMYHFCPISFVLVQYMCHPFVENYRLLSTSTSTRVVLVLVQYQVLVLQ